MQRGLVGSEMCIRDRVSTQSTWETAPVLTESNKKRVFLGLIIGGILFVALLIAIIVLIATADGYTPIPPKPKPVIVSINPYVLTTYYEESISTVHCSLFNNRSALEGVTSQNTEFEPGRENKIINTTENFEPVILSVTFSQLDEHLLQVKYTTPSEDRWEVPVFQKDTCLLYTSDAADDTPCVDLGGRRIIKKKKKI
eukprot:TRINITY_DN12595_c0_g1_i1.p1 TRINITY_DN12595_c0_g1~~TRINITY_DN12595_c0_g1_i1.p1  ORF type:complete len:198 (-),score=42.06 TRINITY_DN12595_c0_g1_i1:81-674(-)